MMAARRTLAQQESRALRHLHHAHGRIPKVAPVFVDQLLFRHELDGISHGHTPCFHCETLEQRNQQRPTPVCRGDRMCMAKDHDENCVWFKW